MEELIEKIDSLHVSKSYSASLFINEIEEFNMSSISLLTCNYVLFYLPKKVRIDNINRYYLKINKTIFSVNLPQESVINFIIFNKKTFKIKYLKTLD